jgi:hypothetical protein
MKPANQTQSSAQRPKIYATIVVPDDRWDHVIPALENGSPIGRFDTLEALAQRWLELETHGLYVHASEPMDPMEYLQDHVRHGVISYVVDVDGVWAYRVGQ